MPSVRLDPIEAIKLRMDQLGMTRKDLEHCLADASEFWTSSPKNRSLALEMIRRLHRALRIPLESLKHFGFSASTFIKASARLGPHAPDRVWSDHFFYHRRCQAAQTVETPAKNEQGDVTAVQIKDLAKLVREEFK